MKLSLVLLSACLAVVMAAPEIVEPALKLRGPSPEAVSEASDIVPRDADGAALFERAGCKYNTGCRSTKGAKAGKYCGYCKQVAYDHPWIGSHVYQLNGKTDSKGCCDYGVSKECQKIYNSGAWTINGPNCPM